MSEPEVSASLRAFDLAIAENRKMRRAVAGERPARARWLRDRHGERWSKDVANLRGPDEAYTGGLALIRASVPHSPRSGGRP